MFSNFCAEFVL